MRLATAFAVVLLVGGLAGCVAPPPPPQPLPLVAVPGPTKTEVQFRQDDVTCRAAAVELPPGAPAQPTAAQPASVKGQTPANSAVAPAAALPPGVLYLRCMTARQNTVEPLAPLAPVVYGYYPAYPIYAGVGFGFPWFYDDAVAFGFHGGGYGRFGYGGYRGYRGYGFREGGFRDGGHHHGGFGHGGYSGGGFGGRGGRR